MDATFPQSTLDATMFDGRKVFAKVKKSDKAIEFGLDVEVVTNSNNLAEVRSRSPLKEKDSNSRPKSVQKKSKGRKKQQGQNKQRHAQNSVNMENGPLDEYHYLIEKQEFDLSSPMTACVQMETAVEMINDTKTDNRNSMEGSNLLTSALAGLDLESQKGSTMQTTHKPGKHRKKGKNALEKNATNDKSNNDAIETEAKEIPSELPGNNAAPNSTPIVKKSTRKMKKKHGRRKKQTCLGDFVSDHPEYNSCASLSTSMTYAYRDFSANAEVGPSISGPMLAYSGSCHTASFDSPPQVVHHPEFYCDEQLSQPMSGNTQSMLTIANNPHFIAPQNHPDQIYQHQMINIVQPARPYPHSYPAHASEMPYELGIHQSQVYHAPAYVGPPDGMACRNFVGSGYCHESYDASYYHNSYCQPSSEETELRKFAFNVDAPSFEPQQKTSN